MDYHRLHYRPDNPVPSHARCSSRTSAQLKLLSLIFLGLSLALAWDQIVNATIFDKRLRAFRAAASGALAYASLALVIRVHHEGRHVAADTAALAAGTPLAALLAGGASWLLYRRDLRAAEKVASEARGARRIDPDITAAAFRLEFKFSSVSQARTSPSCLPAPLFCPCPAAIPTSAMQTALRVFTAASRRDSLCLSAGAPHRCYPRPPGPPPQEARAAPGRSVPSGGCLLCWCARWRFRRLARLAKRLAPKHRGGSLSWSC